MVRATLRLPELERWLVDDLRQVTRQGVSKKAAHIERYLELAYFGMRPHAKPLFGEIRGRTWRERMLGTSSFSSRLLERGLGGSTGRYRDIIKRYWDFPERNENYVAPRPGIPGITKPYILNRQTTAKLNEIWRNDSPGLFRNAVTGRRLNASNFPKNGIVKTSFSSLSVPGILPVDCHMLRETIREQRVIGGEDGEGVKVHKAGTHVRTLRELYRAKKWVLGLGGIPNLYRDYKGDDPARGSGRLWGVGTPHIQSMSRESRVLLLKGSGWHDYDFEACHPTIFAALCRGYGVPLEILPQYLSDRPAWRSQLASDLEIREGKVKNLMNSVLYELPISTWPGSSLTTLLGRDGAARIRDYQPFRDLLNEVRLGATAIVREHRQGDVIVNAVNKVRNARIRPRQGAPFRGEHRRKLCSHVLSGYEAWAVNLVCVGESDIMAVIHDGFITEHSKDLFRLNQLVCETSKNQFKIEIPLTLSEKHCFK